MIVDSQTLKKDWHSGLISTAWRPALPKLGVEGERIQAILLGDRFLKQLQERVRNCEPRYREIAK